MEEDLVCETGQGETLFVLPCICNFLNSVTNLSVFCVNYSRPQTRKALLVDMELLRERILKMFLFFII